MENYKVYMHESPSGKKYVGITKQKPSKRWQNGLAYIDRGGVHFKNAINKYGWDNFKHVILFDGLTEEQAKKKEIELIALHNLTDPKYGYNVSPGGDLRSKESIEKAKKTWIERGHNERTKQRMIEIMSNPENRKKVSMASKKWWENATEEEKAERSKKLSKSRRANKEFIKIQSDRMREYNLTKKDYKLTSEQMKNRTIADSVRYSQAKKVYMINRFTFEVEKIFKSSVDASREMRTAINCIASVCRNNTHGCKGYLWCYEEDYSDEFIANLKSIWINGELPDSYKRESKKVRCIELNKTFESISEACEFTGLTHSPITVACKNSRRTAKGYHWEYIRD